MAEAMMEQTFGLGTQPMLFIGLGGSGGEIVARIKDLLYQTYRDPNHPARQLCQFLVLDADKFENLPKSARTVLDEQSEYIFLGGVNTGEYVAEALRNPSHEAATDLRAWLVEDLNDPLMRQIPRELVLDGARRLRPLGRLLLYIKRTEVEQKVLEKLRTAGALQPLQDRDLQVRPGRRAWAFLVASTCGGTGSGLFFDMVHLVARTFYNQQALAPEIAAVLLLPGIFLDKYRSSGLLPYYAANAWAFWQELKYLLRDGDSLNQWVADANSARWAGLPGQGIPTGQEPLHWVYLFDHELPGLGFFDSQDLSSFYAQVAKAFFYHLYAFSVHSNQALESWLANVRDRRREVDLENVPMKGCTVGFSEVSFPAREARSFLAYRFAAAVLRDHLLAEHTSDGIGKALKELFQRVEQDVLGELEQSFNELRERYWQQYQPDRGAVLDENGRLNRDRLTPDLLESWVAQVKEGAEQARRNLGVHMAQQVENYIRRFEDILRREIDSASGFKGLRLTEGVFKGLDDELEALVGKWREEEQRHQTEAKKLLAEVEAVGENSLRYQLLKPGLLTTRSALTDKLEIFIEKLRALYDALVSEATAHHLRNLLLFLAGEEGDRVAAVPEYDRETGRTVALSERTSSLDQREEELREILHRYQELLSRFSDERLEKEVLWKYEGRPVTSQYLPADLVRGGTKAFAALDQLQGLLQRKLAAGREALLQELLQQVPPSDIRQGNLEEMYRRLLRWSQEKFAGEVENLADIAALLEKDPQKDPIVAKAINFSIQPLSLKAGTKPEGKETLLAPKKAEKLFEAFGAGHTGEGPRHGIFLLRHRFMIPLASVTGFQQCQIYYLQRNLRHNFPHISRQFHRYGVPGAQSAYAPALRVFGQVRALDWWLKAERTGREALGLEVDPMNLEGFKFLSIQEVARPGTLRREGLWVAYLWKWVEVENRYQLMLASTNQLCSSGNYRGGQMEETLRLLEHYISSPAVVENHQGILEMLARNQHQKLVKIVSQWLEQVLGPNLELLRQQLGSGGDREDLRNLLGWLTQLKAVLEREVGPGMPEGVLV